MIRIFLISSLCFIYCRADAQLKLGLQAGYNTSKWKYTVTPQNWETNTYAVGGFNIGGVAQFQAKNNISLQGALFLNRSGTKLKHRYRFDMSSREITLYSLNLPLAVMYNIDVNKLRFGLGAGFYVAWMLSGKEEGTTERFVINGPPIINSIDNKIEFGSAGEPFQPANTSPIILNRFDFGYLIAANIEYNDKLALQASYNAGLRKVLPNGYAFSGNFKNQVLNLSLAVWLFRSKSF